MSRSGFLVRLVDVVLILLFGFISISNTKDSTLDLIESEEMSPSVVDTYEVIFIGVLDDGRYLLERKGSILGNIDEVHTYLLQERRLHSTAPLKVRIRASKNAPVQQVFSLTELCNEIKIENTLEVKVVL